MRSSPAGTGWAHGVRGSAAVGRPERAEQSGTAAPERGVGARPAGPGGGGHAPGPRAARRGQIRVAPALPPRSPAAATPNVAMHNLRADGGTDLPVPCTFRKCCRALARRLAPSETCQDGSTPRPPSPGRTSRSGGYHCPTADRRIAAARLHCCVSAALRGLAVGATRLRLADAGGAGAGKCLRGSAQHAYVAGRALAVCSLDPNRAICSSADRPRIPARIRAASARSAL